MAIYLRYSMRRGRAPLCRGADGLRWDGDEDESEELLNAVFGHAEKEEFVYCHK
jgi:hypothetical protein